MISRAGKIADVQEPSAEARLWIDGVLASSPQGYPQFLRDVSAMQADVQVAVLRECVRRMPLLRDENDYAAGSVLYALACHLFGRKLPFTEDDVCALLTTSRHGCGHGSDVSPPLDIAQAWMQRNGYSQPIIDATRAFITALTGVGSAQATFAKRRGAIMLLADPTERADGEHGWGRHFQAGLRAMNASDRAKWQRLLLQMKANDVYVAPEVWRKAARRFLSESGPTVALKDIEWWIVGADKAGCTAIGTGGSHVMKHLVWLLDEISLDGASLTDCDSVAAHLAATKWTPMDRAAKFMIAATYYFKRRPPDVAWLPLQQIARWNGDGPGKICAMVKEYGHHHALVPPYGVASFDAESRRPLPVHTAQPPTESTESVIARIKRVIFRR